MRKRFYRKRYLETRASHIQLQGLIRGYMSRKRVREQERVAATLIQTSIRGYLESNLLKQFYQWSLFKICQRIASKKKLLKITRIKLRRCYSKSWKAYQARSSYQTQRKSAVIIQSAFEDNMLFVNYSN